MKFASAYDQGAGLISLTGSDNCDTDSWPLVPQVFFRHYQATYDPEMGAIASAILFSSCCGSVAEFQGARIGIDAAKAIRTAVPQIDDVLPVEGLKREIGLGVSSIMVGDTASMFNRPAGSDRFVKAARAVTWSGDFVSSANRQSDVHVGGDVFTNASLVAGKTSVSVALALLIAGRRLREIFIPAPSPDETETVDRIGRGLEFVGIKLRTVPIPS